MLSKFLKNTGGNFATLMAVAAPAFFGVIGLSLDYVSYYEQRDKLQIAADSAALASVKELGLAGNYDAKQSIVQEVANAYVMSAVYGDAGSSASGELTVKAIPDTQNSEVEVELTYRWAPMFAQFFDAKVTPIKITAAARLAGDSLTCVVGLMQPQRLAKSSIHLDDRSVLKADGCAVYSNSVSRYGLRADRSSTMSAQTICTAGGVLAFRRTSFAPEPITDCPKIEDPLLSRQAPTYGNCTNTDLAIDSDAILEPGVYCGGLKISGNAAITLNPGIYVMSGGPLIVSDKASLTGKGVSFILSGAGSLFDFQKETSINLEAMETGPTAGLLFFEERSVPYSFDFDPFDLFNLPADVRIHRITSNMARNLLGTIYLPRSILLIDADAPVADGSAYTAIIAGRLWLREGPILTLNSDFTKTKVPVPDGLIGTEPVLVR